MRTQKRIQESISGEGFHWVLTYRTQSSYLHCRKSILMAMLHCFLYLLWRQSHLLNYQVAGGTVGGRWSVISMTWLLILLVTNYPHGLYRHNISPLSSLKICDINTLWHIHWHIKRINITMEKPVWGSKSKYIQLSWIRAASDFLSGDKESVRPQLLQYSYKQNCMKGKKNWKIVAILEAIGTTTEVSVRSVFWENWRYIEYLCFIGNL